MTKCILIFLFAIGLIFVPVKIGNSITPENIPEVYSQPIKSAKSHAVKATAYTNIARCTDKTPNITASNLKLQNQKHHKRVIALSRDLARHYEFGDLFEVKVNDEIFVAEFQDLMAKRKKNSVDVYMSNLKDCKEWGVKSIRITSLKN